MTQNNLLLTNHLWIPRHTAMMAKHKKNSLDAIVVPHDGPLFALCHQDSDAFSGAVGEAMNLLQSRSSVIEEEGYDIRGPIFSCSVKLISQLQNSNTLREQLSHLRAYRSNILQIKNGEPNSEHGVVTAMYKILFELSLSVQSPQSMKKASYSCLSALIAYMGDMSVNCFDEIHCSIVKSLFDTHERQTLLISPSKFWANPLQTLFEVLSYKPTQKLILKCHSHIVSVLNLLLSDGSVLGEILKTTPFNITSNERSNKEDVMEVVGSNVLDAVEKCFEICTTLKILLTPLLSKQNEHPLATDIERKELCALCVSIIDQLLEPLIQCRATPIDALSVCGVCYGQILLFKWRLEANDEKVIAKYTNTFLLQLVGNFAEYGDEMTSTNVPPESLASLMIVKGLASTLTDSILEQKIESNENVLLMHPIASYIMRMSQYSSNDAIRLWGLKGLETVLGRCKVIVASNPSKLFFSQATELANNILQLSLVTFDSPPCKQVGSAVPRLFQSLVELMEVLDEKNDDNNVKIQSMDVLVTHILAQPPHRKGKYIALDSLLYSIGATKLIQLTESQESEPLVSSFVQEIGNRGNNANSVAELLGKFLSLLREEMHTKAGIDLNRVGESKKERRKKEKQTSEEILRKTINQNEDDMRLLPSWINVWVQPFASALLCSRPSRQSHISSYCLPLIATMVGGTARKVDASHCFAALLNEVNLMGEADSVLWAKLEIIHHANKLLKSNCCSKFLRNEISNAITLDTLKMALIHESSKIRLVAFQTMNPVVMSALGNNLAKDSIKCILLEIKLWKEALPYSFNSSDKEHMLVLNDTLHTFLCRILDIEATCDSEPYILKNFVNDLINNFFLKQAYPGTISEKESCALKLLESISMFASQTRLRKKETPKSRAIEKNWNSSILQTLLSNNVFATLLSLLHSMWDAAREKAYNCTCQLIELARQENMTLPHFFTSKDSYDALRARATHLASSPRQREADTGSKIIAILYLLLATHEEQLKYIKDLSQFTAVRLSQMADFLGVALNQEGSNHNTKRIAAEKSENELPLAHGLIQALRYIIDDKKVISISKSSEIFTELTDIFCQAIEVSLVVVADINVETDQSFEQEDGEEIKQRWRLARAKKTGSTPLNVNTGALGANAAFVSCKPIDEEESVQRLSMQRILVGSWLLIKEACAALSSVMIVFPGKIDYNIISTAGDLLISTLTTLKHQGAAYAAHKSLQKISARCYTKNEGNLTRSLPGKWAQRLIFEISSPDVVRDSTLRRSTGYGLGTLSILRTEEISPRFLFPKLLSSIIKLSLPSTTVMMKYIQDWNFSSSREAFNFVSNLSEEENPFVRDEDYEWRTRIHALNILRLVILDAPLASEMRRYVGDSLISALIGYSDSSWAVRNSATMAFAAVMLRVVDADKNAGGKVKGRKPEVGVSAITATEIFRSYPPLASVLLWLLREETDISRNMLHPSLFPLLLLLSRLQPLSLSRIDPGADDISNMFIEPVMLCLGHVHQKVRIASARAISVLCSGDTEGERDSSRRNLIKKCTKLLSFRRMTQGNHNLDHGALLALKYLLLTCSSPSMYLSENLMSAIEYYGSWGHFKGMTPPSCASTALHIWQIMTKGSKIDAEVLPMNNSTFNLASLKAVAHKVVQYVELCNEKNGGESLIGFAALGSNAAKIVVEASYPFIFNPLEETSRRQDLEIVEKLFCSSSYDVMLQSVKSFKKNICESVDSMIDGISPIQGRMDVLQCIYQTLISSLFYILERDGSSVHPPTQRRLSRCIIETAVGYRRLSGNTSLSQITKYTSNQTFQRYVNMLSLGKETNIMSSNIGNTLELMSLTITELCITNVSHDNYTVDHFERDLLHFVDLIKRSTSPESNWKIRYSAASSIKESGLLRMQVDDSNPFLPTIQRCKMKVYFQFVHLLQDADEDVRKIAAVALLPTSHNVAASLRNLQIGYDEICNKYSSVDLFNMLSEQVIGQCQGVEINLEELINELRFTVGVSDLSDTKNLSSERKIFEEEDLNAFEESLLIVQLSIHKLTQISKAQKDQSQEQIQVFQNLVVTCRKVLQQMKEIPDKIGSVLDIAHNVTWSGKVFAKLYGVLLGSIFAAYHFGIEDDIAEEAKRTYTEYNCIHPCIAEALKTLSFAKYGDDATYKSLLKCCFLIPSYYGIRIN